MFNDNDYQVVTNLDHSVDHSVEHSVDTSKQLESSNIQLTQNDFNRIFKSLLFEIDYYNLHNQKVFFDPTHIYITKDKRASLLMPISSVWFKTEFIDIVHILFRNQSNVFFGKAKWVKTHIESALMFDINLSPYHSYNNENNKLSENKVNTDLINLVTLAENVFNISIPEEVKTNWITRDVLKWVVRNVK